MKKRVLTLLMASLCALTLISSAIAPAMAAPYSDEGTGIETRAQMRVWSVTYGVWKTDWIPVPEGWHEGG